MSVSGPRVTLLLSTYNGARWLPELIDSIEAQNYGNWRVLARDDGSNDATEDVLASWANGSPRVELDAHGSRMSPSGSFMHLLESLDSPVFAFCDQDDVWHPDRLEVGLKHLAGLDPDVDEVAVVSGVEVVDERLAPLPKSARDRPASNPQTAIGPLLLNNMAIGATMMGTAALARSATRLAGGEPVAMHDWWCALVACARGSLVFEPASTVRWRRHGATFTGVAPRGLKGRLDRRRAYLLDARDMARRLLVESNAIGSERALSALAAVAETEPADLSMADYWRLGRAGVSADGWRRRATLLAACVDPSGTTDAGAGTSFR